MQTHCEDVLPGLKLTVFMGHHVHAVPPTASEYMPAMQFVQAALPVTFLYFPAVHAAHGPPFSPLEPALQVQLVITELETGELALAGQAEHAPEPVVPL